MSSDAAATPAGADDIPKTPKGPLLLALINSVVVLAALGALVYTRVLYKRPAITEQGERERLEKVKAAPPAASEAGFLAIDTFTANIEPAPLPAGAEPGTTPTMHFLTIGFSLELGDLKRGDLVTSVKAQVMDKLLQVLGRKKYQELTTVQGRFLLRSQIADTINEVLLAAYPKLAGHEAELVTNVYFTQFLVQ